MISDPTSSANDLGLGLCSALPFNAISVECEKQLIRSNWLTHDDSWKTVTSAILSKKYTFPIEYPPPIPPSPNPIQNPITLNQVK